MTVLLDLHERRMRRSADIAKFQMEVQMEKRFLSPVDVIAVLNREKISFVLAGAYGLAGWMTQARATEDVDLIVALKHVKKATRILTEAFPYLESDDQEVVVRLRDKETSNVLIDLMKPTQLHLRAIFKNTIRVEMDHQEYRVPSLEMALVLKFAPMISLARIDRPKFIGAHDLRAWTLFLLREIARIDRKKFIDAHDFMDIVQRNPEIDQALLTELGDLVYNGGGKEIVEMVRKVRAGEKLTF